jgi:hypothetical protein
VKTNGAVRMETDQAPKFQAVAPRLQKTRAGKRSYVARFFDAFRKPSQAAESRCIQPERGPFGFAFFFTQPWKSAERSEISQ